MSPFITLTGLSNREYVFTALPLNRKLPDSAGVYVITNTICDQEKQVHHQPVLIGSCDNLSKRFDETDIQELRNEGANYICVKIEQITENRHQIERDLMAKYFSNN